MTNKLEEVYSLRNCSLSENKVEIESQQTINRKSKRVR